MYTTRFFAIGLTVIACASLTGNAVSNGAPDTMAMHPSTDATPSADSPAAELLATGLQGASGSAIGPDGALYVTEGAVGRISRIDPRTGAVTTFASGLPPAVVGIGGAIDVAFIGRTAYALVTLVGADVMGDPRDTVGIYRVDKDNTFTVVADLGTFSKNHPPDMPIDVPSGLQYALEPYRGGFLVTDGHHNRVLFATVHNRVNEVIAFDNVVPTGLAASGSLVFVAQAGPVPHRPEDGKVVVFHPRWPFAVEIASGARLLVDVEFGPDRTLYALSQGALPEDAPPATPALPHTGALVKVDWDGGFTEVAPELNQPTSLEFIGNTAYVVTLGGEVWKLNLRRHSR